MKSLMRLNVTAYETNPSVADHGFSTGLRCWSCRRARSGLGGPAAEGARLRFPEYRTVKLGNGITLFLLERHGLPLVNFEWIMKTGGSIDDPPGQEGLASLTAELLRKGTESRTARQISEALDFVGATWEASAGHDYAAGSCEFVKKDLDLELDLVSDLLRHPASQPRKSANSSSRGPTASRSKKPFPARSSGVTTITSFSALIPTAVPPQEPRRACEGSGAKMRLSFTPAIMRPMNCCSPPLEIFPLPKSRPNSKRSSGPGGPTRAARRLLRNRPRCPSAGP